MPITKPETKVVDNMRTQMEELADAIDQLYDQANAELSQFNFDEISSVLIEGFKNVMDRRPPIDVVPDQQTDSESESNSDSGFDEEDEETRQKEEECQNKQREETANKIMRMIESWSSPNMWIKLKTISSCFSATTFLYQPGKALMQTKSWLN